MWKSGMEEEVEKKAKLVRNICFISSAFASCHHLRQDAQKKVFIDWYLILGVGEDSELDAIRRQYRQMALQLHPDKNKHPKAEVAFKLVSEAYACLSDKARRKNFNSEKRRNFCKECYKKWLSNQLKNNDNGGNKSYNEDNGNNNNNGQPRPKKQTSTDRVRRCQILQAWKQVQKRFRDESRVIESCLRTTMKASGSESPLFDPCDRNQFPNYPHRRTSLPMGSSSGYSFFQHEQNCSQDSYESPVYQGTGSVDLAAHRSNIGCGELASDGSKSCADCQTTKTPLWRCGPSGPKSLCNACGIRYSKKRRVVVGFKERRLGGERRGRIEEIMRKMRMVGLGRRMMRKQEGMGEEEEAALLLMAISSGFLYV
ncbi:hypothetical protein HPP92_016729 [Vanilla planifolia]|uniref:Uncharacterized protein n=1 Tax=Vanilla planifolia TaxID=51239 RepID=A0A835QIP2_VANPL|nr:hypothetical protein HPP92_016729 [Vanilla planifolia]